MSAALLTQMLNLPPNLQSDGNVVAGMAAVQHGCLLSRSRGNGLVESVRNEQEVRTILHRGTDNMPEMRKRLKMDVEPDPGQRALSAVVSTPSISGGPANAPLSFSYGWVCWCRHDAADDQSCSIVDHQWGSATCASSSSGR